MTDSIFLDTNILVYAYDKHDPKKQATAQVLLKEGIETESAEANCSDRRKARVLSGLELLGIWLVR